MHIYALDLVPPASMEINNPAGGIETGRSLTGDPGAIDFSGGGLWMVKYKQVCVFTPDQHRYWNRLRFMLNSRARAIVVPLLTDWIAPVPTGMELGTVRIGGITNSDGTTFSDSSAWSQSTISAVLAGNAALNAGTVQIKVIAGGALIGGETFSILHSGKGWRCYGIADVDGSVVNGDGSTTYTVGITPPIREAAGAGTGLKFDRPQCSMRLAPGTDLPWVVETYWESRPDISFVEA